MGLIYHVIQHVAYARSRLLSSEDVEDIAAEIFLKIVDNDYAVLKKFKGTSSLPTYLTVIARRTCVKELIKRHREEELGHTNAHRAFADDGISEEVEAIISAEEVERMLEDLTEREAEVVGCIISSSRTTARSAKSWGCRELGRSDPRQGPQKAREAAEKQQSARVEPGGRRRPVHGLAFDLVQLVRELNPRSPIAWPRISGARRAMGPSPGPREDSWSNPVNMQQRPICHVGVVVASRHRWKSGGRGV